MPLTLEEITILLEKDKRKTHGYPPPIQNGPLRWYDKGSRCLSRGCGVYTYTKVNGMWKCTMHALAELNQIIIDLTENRNGSG